MAEGSRVPYSIEYNNYKVCINLGEYIEPNDIAKLLELTRTNNISVFVYNNPNIDDSNYNRNILELFKYESIIEKITKLTLWCNIDDGLNIVPPNIKYLCLDNCITGKLVKLPPSCQQLVIRNTNSNRLSLENQTDVKMLTINEHTGKITGYPINVETVIYQDVHEISNRLPLMTKSVCLNYNIFDESTSVKMMEDITKYIQYLPDNIETLVICLYMETHSTRNNVSYLFSNLSSDIYLPQGLKSLQYIINDVFNFTDDMITLTNSYIPSILDKFICKTIAPSIIKLCIIFELNAPPIPQVLNELNTLSCNQGYNILKSLKYLMLQFDTNFIRFDSSDLNMINMGPILVGLDNLEKLVLSFTHSSANVLPNFIEFPPNINELNIISIFIKEFREYDMKDVGGMLYDKLIRILDILPNRLKLFKFYLYEDDRTKLEFLDEYINVCSGIKDKYARKNIEFEFIFSGGDKMCMNLIDEYDVTTNLLIKEISNLNFICNRGCDVCQYKKWWSSLV